jgi:hypothetical protein
VSTPPRNQAERPPDASPRRFSTLGELAGQLAAEHRLIEQTLRRLAGTGPGHPPEGLIRELDGLLSRHTSLELDVFYPAAHALLVDADEISIATTSAVEHEPLLALMGMLEQSSREDPLFVPRIEVLRRHVARHFAEEEGQLFRELEARGYFGYSLEYVSLDDRSATKPGTGPHSILH